MLSAVSVACVAGGSDLTGWIAIVFAAASCTHGVNRLVQKSPARCSREVEFVRDTFHVLCSVRVQADDLARYVSIFAAAKRLH